jgi:hypothetical protein
VGQPPLAAGATRRKEAGRCPVCRIAVSPIWGTVKRAWAAQVRLSGRFRRLAARKNSKNVVATAVARELCGFLWAEMTAA